MQVVEECPEGYPELAAFLDSDENFMLYRRFGFVQARVLLEKQDELRLLEERLDDLDKAMRRKDEDSLRTRDLSEEDGRPRKELLGKIETKSCEYGNRKYHLLSAHPQ